MWTVEMPTQLEDRIEWHVGLEGALDVPEL